MEDRRPHPRSVTREVFAQEVPKVRSNQGTRALRWGGPACAGSCMDLAHRGAAAGRWLGRRSGARGRSALSLGAVGGPGGPGWGLSDKDGSGAGALGPEASHRVPKR